MNNPFVRNVTAISLLLGGMFADCYRLFGANDPRTKSLLESYKSARRALPFEGMKRPAHFHAWRATQGI